jgi:Zn finger protein HypA/HybF involved in hydrogenase expression
MKHENCPHCGTSKGEHYVRKWEKWCPECHEPNPNFTSFASCKNCGLPLGTKEDAKKLEKCPECGSTEAKILER